MKVLPKGKTKVSRGLTSLLNTLAKLSNAARTFFGKKIKKVVGTWDMKSRVHSVRARVVRTSLKTLQS